MVKRAGDLGKLPYSGEGKTQTAIAFLPRLSKLLKLASNQQSNLRHSVRAQLSRSMWEGYVENQETFTKIKHWKS